MAARYIAGGGDMPELTANKIRQYCNKISERLWDDAAATDVFRAGIAAVDTAVAGVTLTRDLVKTQTFTDAVKAALHVTPKSSPANP